MAEQEIDPQKYTKPELIELAEQAGVDTSGTKPEIAARINGAEVPDRPTEDAPGDGNPLGGVDTEPVDIVSGGATTTPARRESDVEKVDPAVSPHADGAPADHAEAKEAELAGKEASVPPSDPRDSVTDHAPGKTLDDVVAQKAAHDAGENQGESAVTSYGVQHYIVQDETDLIGVAKTLGLFDHSELASLNGRYNGRHDVQRGQRVVLPSHYDFSNLENVEVS